MAIAIYLLMLVLIFWVYCGYLLTIYALIIIGRQSKYSGAEIGDYPSVSILIPSYNEAACIKQKVKNLQRLDYPQDKLEVIFLDGNSTDQTHDVLKKETANIEYVKVMQTGCRGKINQLNYILPKVNSEIIVNTDMDTILEKDTLRKIIDIFKTDAEIFVVGAHVIPKSSLSLEREYWYLQNRTRFLESRVYASSIVAAPCYAFRKGLIKKFPEDCIADDIYISFYANTKGKKTKYAEGALAYEARCPDNIITLLQHKFRKGNAYIIELLRFIYLLAYMHPRWKMIFFTKFLQVVVIPWIIPFFIISSISLIFSGYSTIILHSFAFLFISFLLVHFIFIKGKKAAVGRQSHLPFSVFIITNALLLLNGISFPFYKQTSRYEKLGVNKK